MVLEQCSFAWNIHFSRGIWAGLRGPHQSQVKITISTELHPRKTLSLEHNPVSFTRIFYLTTPFEKNVICKLRTLSSRDYYLHPGQFHPMKIHCILTSCNTPAFDPQISPHLTIADHHALSFVSTFPCDIHNSLSRKQMATSKGFNRKASHAGDYLQGQGQG